MDTTASSKPPLTKTELGSIVGFIAIVTAWVFISGHMGAESARKDRLLREYEHEGWRGALGNQPRMG